MKTKEEKFNEKTNIINKKIREGNLIIKASKLILPIEVFNDLISLPYDDRCYVEEKLSKRSFKRLKTNTHAYLSDYLILVNEKVDKENQWFHYDIDLGILFKKLYNNDTYSVKEFFKYLPYLKRFEERLIEVCNYTDTFGYCCEDCSGDYGEYIQRERDYKRSDILHELNKIKINI